MVTALQKRKIEKVIHSRWFILLLALLAFLLSLTGWREYESMQKAQARYADVAEKLVEYEAREQELEAELADLQDPRGIEATLRERYSVAKEGEVVVVLTGETEEELQEEVEEKKGVWMRMVDFFQ
jgi:cell division protein FtsB